ncbi:GNAT family protein, partial [Acinetobacter baumannii]|nr:GNAT family protein [Acinetobacter baumannii]
EWMLEQGFSRLGLRTLFATCASVNERSERLLRRLNFKFIGNRMSDNALVDEYQPQKVWKFSKNQQANQTTTNNYQTTP